MYECDFCDHREEDIDMMKEHIKENHVEEFYDYCFDEWADDFIIEVDRVVD